MNVQELFPPGESEVLVEEGVYRYRENDRLTAIVEPWSRYRFSGDTITRALRTDGEHFVLGVKHSLQKDAVATELLWRNLQTEEEIASSYRLTGGKLKILRDQSPELVKDVSDGLLYFPLMRVFTGPVILGLIGQGGSGQVLVPSIKTPGDADSLFEPLFSERFAERLVDPATTGPDGCECFRYGGAQYADGAFFWLDKQGLLREYQWQQSEDSHWQVSLAEYRHC